MNPSRSLRSFLKASIVSLGLSALALPVSVHAQNLEKINIGVSNRSLLGLPILIAKEKKIFEQEGLDVNIDYFAGGTPATAALLGGSVQYIDAAFENNVKVVQRGQPVVSIMNLQSDFAGAIIVRKDVAEKLKFPSKLTTQHLKGLRVGTLTRGGFADVATRYIAVEAGLDPEKDLELIPIRGADRQLQAGESDAIDAAFVMEPWNVIGVDGSKKWRYLIDITKGEGPSTFQRLGYTTLQTTRQQVQTKRATTEKVVRAVANALKYIRDEKNLDDVAAIADKEYGGAGKGLMKHSLKRQANTFSPALVPDSLKKTGQLLAKSGASKANLPAFEEVADLSFAPFWSGAIK